MALRQTPPGKGSQRKRTHFAYVSTQAGKTWEAYIAGPCLWFECHTKGRSKPCLSIISEDALKCPICSPTNLPEVIGYQPLYRGSDARPCFVIVHEEAADRTDALKFRQPVHVGRDGGPTDGVWILPRMGKPAWYTSTLPERQYPVDLTPSLIAVWKIEELTAWYNSATKHNVKTTTLTTPQPAPPPPPAPPPRPNKLQERLSTVSAPGDPSPIEVELRLIAERIQRNHEKHFAPNPNGTKPH